MVNLLIMSFAVLQFPTKLLLPIFKIHKQKAVKKLNKRITVQWHLFLFVIFQNIICNSFI